MQNKQSKLEDKITLLGETLEKQHERDFPNLNKRICEVGDFGRNLITIVNIWRASGQLGSKCTENKAPF